MRDFFKQFRKDRSGVAFVMIALLLPIVFLVILLTVDLSEMQYAEASNSAAADSTASGIADYIGRARVESKEPTPAEMKGYGLKIMQSNLADIKVAELIPSKFSVELANDKVTVSSCMSVQGSGFLQITGNGGEHTICSEGSAKVMAISICAPDEQPSEGPCPMGQKGTIKYIATRQCPSGVWGAPLPVSNTCKADCTPSTTSEVKPCPEGLTGAGITMTTSISCPGGDSTTAQTSYSCDKPCEQKSETNTEQCSQTLNNSQAVGTITKTRTSICPSGAWGEWIQTKYECCVPDVEKRTQNCPSGQTGEIKQERVKSCPAGTFGEWKNISNTCVTPPPVCGPKDVTCQCGVHPRWWFNIAAYNANALEFLCGKCAPGMSSTSSSGGCIFSGMTQYPKTVAGDIVCGIRADGNNGSMLVTPAAYPQGCNEPLYKDLADSFCIKWVNGQKVDISKVTSGTCKASQYPNSNPKTKAGDTICVRYKNGTMMVTPAGKPNGCDHT